MVLKAQLHILNLTPFSCGESLFWEISRSTLISVPSAIFSVTNLINNDFYGFYVLLIVEIRTKNTLKSQPPLLCFRIMNEILKVIES